jgi:hypothetical protein
MAAAQHKLSRRALLGAACAAPVLSSVEGPVLTRTAAAAGAPSDYERLWRRALTRYRRAEAALEAVAHTQDDHLYDLRLGHLNCTLRRLLRTPAPHLAAMAAKLDLLVLHEMWELTGGDRCITALQHDAHRFASADPAPRIAASLLCSSVADR